MKLKEKAFSAGRWTASSTLLNSILQLVQISILARILSPADFGLMAVSASIISVLLLFSDFGLSRAIIHFEDISSNVLHSLYWLNLLIGLALSLCFAAVSPWIGKTFNLIGLSDVLLALSPLFFLIALGQQYCALAEKKLRFSDLAKKEVFSAASGFASAIVIACSGGGVYALVGAALISSAIGSLIAWTHLSEGYRPRLRLNISEASPYIRYGRYLVGEGVLGTLLRQTDIFVAGLFLNSTKIGAFSLPRDLSLRIGMTVNPIITRIGFPVMSRLQSDVGTLKSVYMQTMLMTASVNFPIYIALSLYANEIVAFLYGHQWEHSANYLRILAIWGLLRSVGNPMGSLLHAVGAVRRAFWWNLVSLLAAASSYWIATNEWGLSGLVAIMLGFHIVQIPLMWWISVRPTCGASFVEYMSQLFTPLVLSLIAGSISWLLTLPMPFGALRLFAGCLLGGLAYLALSRIFNRTWFDTVWATLKLPPKALN